MLNLSEIKKSKIFITQIIRGATFLSVGTIIYALCRFVFKYLLLHTWSPKEYGIFTLIITIAGILGIFTEFNLNATTTIFLAKDLKNPENKKTLVSVLISFLLLISICLSISLLIVYFPTNLNTPVLETFRHYFVLIWLLVIATGITAIGHGLARAYKRMDYEAISKAISGLAIVGILALIVYAFSKCSIAFSVVVLIISQIFAFSVISLLLKKRVVSINPDVSAKKVLEYLKRIKLLDISSVLTFSFYMSGMGMIGIILFSIDKFMIPAFLSTEMLGFYAGAYFIVAIPKIITGNLGAAIQSFVPEKSDNLSDAKRQYLAFLAIFMFIAVIGYGLFICFARYSLILLPEEYSWITPVIQILLFGMFFSDIFWLNATFISSMKRIKTIKEIIVILGVVTIINIMLNYIFIPHFGIAGAAMATAISFILIGIISIIQVMKLR